MTDILQLLGIFTLSFSLSCAVAYFLVKRREHSHALKLEPGTTLRIRTGGAMYRSTLVQAGDKLWALSAPLQRDSHVPIRPTERLLVQAADDDGAYFFRTEVISRDVEAHQLIVRAPKAVKRLERRVTGGRRREVCLPASLDGQEARVIDLSSAGARIATRANVGRGQRVRLDMAGHPEPIYGWVLDQIAGSDLGYESSEVRVRFEEFVKTLPK
jgi:hypothetical protein